MSRLLFAFLFLVLLALGGEAYAGTVDTSLLDLGTQLSEPLRVETQNLRDPITLPEEDTPGKEYYRAPCDPSHGDCVRKNPEYFQEFRPPNILKPTGLDTF